MSQDEHSLHELVKKLETAWNASDSVTWAAQFADDADFIHILGGHFHGREAVERGHRQIFDTIYKGSHNTFQVERIRFVSAEVAIVFIRAHLKWFLNGAEQHIDARPTLVAHKKSDGAWEIVAFQNTLITPGGPTPDVVKKLTDVHPHKGE
jgi:uncharacterized protein (TIGR02246 family)